MSDTKAALRDFLAQQSAGELGPAAVEVTIGLLASCWDELDGSSAESMNPEKLPDRAEELVWNPPILSFRIERHGGTVLGSTRAEVHGWDVDVEQGIARCDPHAGYRQVRPTSPRLHVKPIAEEIARHVMSDADHRAMKWSEDRCRVRIQIGAVIAGTGFKQTVADRRKRFRASLRERLPGWRETSPNVWARMDPVPQGQPPELPDRPVRPLCRCRRFKNPCGASARFSGPSLARAGSRGC